MLIFQTFLVYWVLYFLDCDEILWCYDALWSAKAQRKPSFSIKISPHKTIRKKIPCATLFQPLKRHYSELEPRNAPYWKLRILRSSRDANGGTPLTSRLQSLLGFRREAKQIRSAEQSMQAQVEEFWAKLGGICLVKLGGSWNGTHLAGEFKQCKCIVGGNI